MPQTGPPCVLTVQYNNARQDASIYENALTVGSVMGAMAGKSIFKVDKSGLPIPYGTNPPFPTNPVYAQPLYVAGLTVGAGTYNVLYVAALNGEVYAYSADHASVSSTSECVTVGTNGCLWFRDETNSPGMRGLKHNCDTGAGPGNSVVGPAIPGYLEFAGTISTPVIEAKGAAAAIYVTNLCAKTDASEHWYLNALSLTSGATLGVTEITYNTIVSSPNGPQQAFAPASQLQRPGLLLASSTAAGVCSSPPCRSVIASFGTAVDETTMQYQGWMFAYNGNSPSTLSSQTPAPYTTECYYPPETTGRPAACDPLDAEYPFNQCGQGGGLDVLPGACGKYGGQCVRCFRQWRLRLLPDLRASVYPYRRHDGLHRRGRVGAQHPDVQRVELHGNAARSALPIRLFPSLQGPQLPDRLFDPNGLPDPLHILPGPERLRLGYGQRGDHAVR